MASKPNPIALLHKIFDIVWLQSKVFETTFASLNAGFHRIAFLHFYTSNPIKKAYDAMVRALKPCTIWRFPKPLGVFLNSNFSLEIIEHDSDEFSFPRTQWLLFTSFCSIMKGLIIRENHDLQTFLYQSRSRSRSFMPRFIIILVISWICINLINLLGIYILRIFKFF